MRARVSSKPLLRSQEYLTDTLILIIHQLPSIDRIIIVTIFEYQQGPWYLPDVRRGYLISININNAELFMIIIIPPVTCWTDSFQNDCHECWELYFVFNIVVNAANSHSSSILSHNIWTFFKVTQVDWCTRSIKVVNSVNSAKFETHKPWLSLSVDCIS